MHWTSIAGLFGASFVTAAIRWWIHRNDDEYWNS